MHNIKWSSDFEVGIEKIDDQHHQLVDMITTLGSSKDHADNEAVRALIGRLNDYVRDHFALEERMMDIADIDPDFVARHRSEHTYYRGALKDFTVDYDAGRCRVTAPLIDYLLHWLLHHIVVTDRTMARTHLHAGSERAAEIMRQAQYVTEDLTESERLLITELQHANAALAQQVDDLTRQLEALQRAQGPAH